MKETYKMGKWVRPENYRERKHNLVYRTTVRVGEEEYFYIGKHSTDVLEDGYIGSGPKFRRFLREHPDSEISREVLSDWSTVEEALLEEERVVTLGMLRNPHCLNSIKGGGTFDTSGRVPSQEERENHSRRLKGHPASEKQKRVVSQMFRGRQSPTRGKVWVILGEEHRLVDPEDLQKWVDAGYQKARPVASSRGSENFHKNSVWVHRGEESKLIRKEELKEYLESGFEEGRVLGKGKKVWMVKKGEKPKMVKIEDISNFEKLGWIRGRYRINWSEI